MRLPIFSNWKDNNEAKKARARLGETPSPEYAASAEALDGQVEATHKALRLSYHRAVMLILAGGVPLVAALILHKNPAPPNTSQTDDQGQVPASGASPPAPDPEDAPIPNELIAAWEGQLEALALTLSQTDNDTIKTTENETYLFFKKNCRSGKAQCRSLQDRILIRNNVHEWHKQHGVSYLELRNPFGLFLKPIPEIGLAGGEDLALDLALAFLAIHDLKSLTEREGQPEEKMVSTYNDQRALFVFQLINDVFKTIDPQPLFSTGTISELIQRTKELLHQKLPELKAMFPQHFQELGEKKFLGTMTYAYLRWVNLQHAAEAKKIQTQMYMALSLPTMIENN